MDEDSKDVKELKEVLQVVSTEIPKLLESISSTMYKSDNVENLGKAIAKFYKELIDAGMDQKQAFELTRSFMSSFSLGGMISQAINAGARGAAEGSRDE